MRVQKKTKAKGYGGLKRPSDEYELSSKVCKNYIYKCGWQYRRGDYCIIPITSTGRKPEQVTGRKPAMLTWRNGPSYTNDHKKRYKCHLNQYGSKGDKKKKTTKTIKVLLAAAYFITAINAEKSGTIKCALNIKTPSARGRTTKTEKRGGGSAGIKIMEKMCRGRRG